MVFGPLSINLPPISASSYQIQRASEAKLYLASTLTLSFLAHSCRGHCLKGNITQRLYFLIQLKRAGVPHVQLLHFYTSVICPVLEYAVPVWHHLRPIAWNHVYAPYNYLRAVGRKVLWSSACVCLSVCLCVRTVFVRKISQERVHGSPPNLVRGSRG